MAGTGGTRLFFAYGTLRRDAPMHALIGGVSRFLSEARFQGRLWDLGAYPGVTDAGSRHVVHGELYELPETEREALLDSLDRYEGDAFERAERAVVTPDGGRQVALLYLFVGSTRGARHIESGDYLDDLKTTDPAARRG